MKRHWGAIAVGVGLVVGAPAQAAAQDNAACLACHSRAAMFQGRENADSLVVTEAEYAGSVHGAMGMTCVMCHRDLAGSSFPHVSDLAPPVCSSCHVGVGRLYDESVHGYALSRDNPRAPSCVTCHGRHAILPSGDPNSPTYRANLVVTCAACHGEAGLLTDQVVRLPEMVSSYAQSVHGRRTAAGDTAAASCSDCHGVHGLKGPNDPTSSINHANVSATCGQCHGEIAALYERSIHGQALATGVRDSPTCIDCHGEHLILGHEDPDARTCASQQATQTCGPCHDDPVIIAKYNLQGGVVGTYVDSYHGWASRRGCEEQTVASCVDCHTAHRVLPDSDPASTIHAENLVSTCGQCHERADERFARAYTHETTSITTNPVNRIIRIIYIVAIIVIIGIMALHNLLVMNYFIIERRRAEKRTTEILRLDKSQIVQHLLLASSFTVLVITGFALRFPEAWWVTFLSELGMTEIRRADTHRVAAVILVVVSLMHVYYVIANRRGRDEFRAILPAPRDFVNFWNALRFYTWRTEKHVEHGRYDYTQKAEYWALIWGTVLMVLTGFVLWFPTEAANLLPSWGIPAAQTIHYYEAWLATLAIIVWHFFFTIFHPDFYPMSWTWLSGKMTKEMVKQHHRRWYDRMESAEEGGTDVEDQTD
jgi:cytochrome b subunit of formate dehydrogenase